MKTIKKPGILINRLPEDMQEDAIALRGYVGTLEARIEALEGENERLATANEYADTFGYRRAIAEVLALPIVPGQIIRNSRDTHAAAILVSDIERLTTERKGG